MQTLEKGSWVNDKNERYSFSSANQWIFDQKNHLVTLQHLRRGYPIFLVQLKADKGRVISLEEYLCNKDIYTAEIDLLRDFFELKWKVTGPKKKETITWIYQ